MKVTLKLYASLGQYLPDHAEKNEVEVEIEQETSVEGVLAKHGVPPEHCHLVLINGHYLAPSESAVKTLKDGDALAIWPPVAGGKK
ncbi:MAG: MoaD/ThiS family protein [Rhodospirillaceae bacterium]|nr:MoaD/ThiS family protein [Rhodospirillaceae bacterium]MBL6930314.1 MoaD/ThiS family protein [Rhodospirillales bacterium]